MVQLKALRKDNKKLKNDLESAKHAEAIAHKSLQSADPASEDDINLESLKRVRDLERTVKRLRVVSLLHPLVPESFTYRTHARFRKTTGCQSA